MNKYFSDKYDSYFEESNTTVKSEKIMTAKQVIDNFKERIMDSRYIIRRPTARKLGNVKKQD